MGDVAQPKVTVYIPCRSYGRFLARAVESVFQQTYTGWELIIIDDGSTDETATIADSYAKRDRERIRVFKHAPSRGLQACANLALEAARGDYIMRLDADDFLDESSLLVLVSYLDSHEDVGLVYPNYTYVDERGEVLGVENRKKIGQEVKLLDLPAHGACTMVRKRVLKAVGGYDETLSGQDGHDLWLKVVNRYRVANVSTPLFYYRLHDDSLSGDERHILAVRRRIKRNMVGQGNGKVKPRIVAIVPAKNTYGKLPNIVLGPFAGRPLLDYTLDAARASGIFETILVTTDDPRVSEYCAQFGDILAIVRPGELSRSQVHLSEVLHHAVRRLEQEQGIYPDIVVLLSVHSPLRRSEHIVEAVDTLLLYNVDSVLSVYEDYDLHFRHGEEGLEAINKGMLQALRLEREALFVGNGAISVAWRDVVREADCFGKKIGHIVMRREESFQIKSPFDAWLIAQILQSGKLSLDGVEIWDT